MSDEVDQANEHIERERAAVLARRKPAGPFYTGRCWFCDCIVTAGLRWCDSTCRDDWDKEQGS